MPRVQLASRMSDLETTALSASLLGMQPAERRPGYAHFAVTEPAGRPSWITSASRSRPRPAREYARIDDRSSTTVALSRRSSLLMPLVQRANRGLHPPGPGRSSGQ